MKDNTNIPQTIEVAIYNNGYRPGAETLACHSRKRYRLVAKNPHTVSPPPDTNLWLVHYHQCDPQKMMPAAQVQVTPMNGHFFQERRQIEAQGRLERQEFMLHDREKWPQLKMPGRVAPGGQMYPQQSYPAQNPMAHMGNPRFSGQYYQQQQPGLVGPSPAKRQRQHAPPHTPGATAAMAVQDTTLEDEEDVTLPDFLDNLNQRDISMTRYVQHHEWMEEVFSSPYATGQIVPIDLGFGLMGELSGLTDGIFETLAAEKEKAAQKNGDGAYKKIEPENLQEFESRVKEHLNKGQAELQRMKDEHAKKMEELRRTKTLSRAEARLRTATWDDSEDVETANGTTNGHADGAEAIVDEVKTLLGVTIQPQKEAMLIEKGGLREKVRPPPVSEPAVTNGAMEDVRSNGFGQLQPQVGNQQHVQESLAAAQMSRQPSTASQAQPEHLPMQPFQVPAVPQSEQPAPAQLSQQQPQQQPRQQPQQQVQRQPSEQARQQPEISAPDASLGDMDDMGNMDTLGDDMLMDDMDLDVDDTNLEFDDPVATEDQSTLDNQMRDRAQEESIITSKEINVNNNPPQQGSNAQDNAQGNNNHEPDLFGTTDGTFDDFGGDGLIDFDAGDGLDLGMDNSAFGDAFDATEPRDEAGGD